MSEDNVTCIHQRLDEIQDRMHAKQAEVGTNRDACIEVIRMITDTVNSIDPERIRAVCYGSYMNESVANFPVYTIQASHLPTYVTLAEWKINASGLYSAPEITKEDVINTVLKGLDKVLI